MYPQKGCQPDRDPGFYTTGLVPANQHRNLDALNLKIALVGAPNQLNLPRANSVCGGEGANRRRSETRFSPGVSCLTNAGC